MHATVIDNPRPGPHFAAGTTYVRFFWTPVLGPTASLLWDRLLVDANVHGRVDLVLIGSELGVMPRVARHALARLAQFGFAEIDGDVNDPDATVRVYGKAHRLSVRAVERLSPRLQSMHLRYQVGTAAA